MRIDVRKLVTVTAGIVSAAMLMGLTELAASDDLITLGHADYKKTTFSVGAETTLHEWEIRDTSKKRNHLSIIAVVAPRDTFGLRVIRVELDGRIPKLLEQIDCRNRIVLSNGGFYIQNDDGTRQPLGLAQSEGVEISPFSPRSFGGFLAWTGKELRVIPVKKRNEVEESYEALQSSPILVHRQKNDIYSDDNVLFNRVAIGFTVDGDVVVLGAFRRKGSAVSLYAFADLILEMADNGGPSVQSALAMDGGPSSGIAIPVLKKEFGYSGVSYLPNAVCIYSK